MKHYLGCDPGKNGGLALVHDYRVLEYCPMPDTLPEINRFFRDALLRSDGRIACIVERVGARPGQGVCSMFSFGRGYGCLQMAAVCHGMPLHLVTPQAWKKIMLAGMDQKKKQASIDMVINLFPGISLIPDGCRTPHDGMSEAILLATYGLRMRL